MESISCISTKILKWIVQKRNFPLNLLQNVVNNVKGYKQTSYNVYKIRLKLMLY